jgi:hypothetical protein
MQNLRAATDLWAPRLRPCRRSFAEELRPIALRADHPRLLGHPRHIFTVAKHGDQVLTVIHDALVGNPWIPPIPDPP